MKRYLLLIFLIILTGCESKKLTCKLKVHNNDQNYELSAKYVIHYTTNKVSKLESIEKYKSSDKSIIDYYDNYLQMTYLNFDKNYGHIDYQKSHDNTSITYKSTIDFSKISAKKLVKNNYIDIDYVTNDRINISGMRNMYEKKGAICN